MAVFPYSWGRRCKITIDHTKLTGDVEDFPLLLIEDNFPSAMMTPGASAVQEGGGDIRFSTDIYGVNQLACEVVTCSPSAGLAEVYVNVPDISSSTDTDIYVYWYVPAGPVTQPDPDEPFGAYECWSDYGAVFHMDQATGDIINSANQDYNLTRYNTPELTTGKIGDCQDFERLVGYADKFSGDMESELALAGQMTWEMWIKGDDIGNYNFSLMTVTKNSVTNVIRFRVYDDGTGYMIAGGFKDEDEVEWGPLDMQYLYNSGTGVNTNWLHLQATVTGSQFRVCYGYEGEIIYCSTLGGLPPDVPNYPTYHESGNDTITIGSGFFGKIDEVRIQKKSQSYDFLYANHKNQDEPETFSTPGTPTSPTYVWNESLEETLDLGDSLSPIVNINISLTEEIELEDITTRQIIIPFSVEETIQFEDVLAGSATISGSLEENLELAETLTGALTANPSLEENLELEDVIYPQVQIDESLEETIQFSDSLAVQVLFNPSISEAILFSDGWVVYSSADYPCTDTYSEWVCAERQWQDDIKAKNEWIPPYTYYDETLEEGLTLSDIISAQATMNPSASETISFDDIVAWVYNESLSDTINFSDSISVNVIFSAQIEDTIAFGDNITVVLTVNADLTDEIRFRDRLSNIYNFHIHETLSLQDQIAVSKVISINIIENLLLSSDISAKVDFNAVLGDEIVFGEITGWVYNLSLEETLQFSDEIDSSQYYKVKAYFSAYDKTFTFIVKRRDANFIAVDRPFNFEASKRDFVTFISEEDGNTVFEVKN